MTNKTQIAELQDLKSMAEDAAKIYGDTWDSALVCGGESGNYHAITSEKTEDVVARANDDNRHSSWLCDYLEAVSPKKIINLVDQLEAAGARIAELDAEWKAQEERAENAEGELAALRGDEVPVAYLYQYAGCETCEGFRDWREELSRERPPEWMIKTGKVSGLVELFTHAQPVPVVSNDWLPENLDRALTILGVALPVSKEEFNFQAERWMQRLINKVIKLGDEIVTQPVPVVVLEKLTAGEVMHRSGFDRQYAEGWCSATDWAINQCKLAGITVKSADSKGA